MDCISGRGDGGKGPVWESRFGFRGAVTQLDMVSQGAPQKACPHQPAASDNGTLPIHKGGWASQSLARIGSRYTPLSCHEEEEDEEQV